MDDRDKAKKMLFPGLAVAGLVLLVAAVLVIGSGGSGTSDSKNKTGGPGGSNIDLLTDGTKPNDNDPGLRDIGDGLKIRDLKVGEGEEVKPGANVTAHYTGWLKDGTIFDSSRRRGQPIDFPLNRVVQGWQRGIPGMKVGGIRKLVIPPELGYGTEGSGGAVPPNATLIFEVEMVATK